MSMRIEAFARQNAAAREAFARHWSRVREGCRERREALNGWSAISAAMLIVLAAPSVGPDPLEPTGPVAELAIASDGSDRALIAALSACDRCLQATEKQ